MHHIPPYRGPPCFCTVRRPPVPWTFERRVIDKMVNKGDRVKLVSTSDPYTNLRPGARGTVTDIDTIPGSVTGGTPERQIWVDWDDGSKLALIQGQDEFTVIDDEPE